MVFQSIWLIEFIWGSSKLLYERLLTTALQVHRPGQQFSSSTAYVITRCFAISFDNQIFNDCKVLLICTKSFFFKLHDKETTHDSFNNSLTKGYI